MIQQARIVLACIAFLGAGRAAADDFIAELNRRYAGVSPAQRSETVLLPAMAKSTPAPEALVKLWNQGVAGRASLGPGSSVWGEAIAWVQAPPQKALLEAMDKATRETDWQKAMIFAQPYGVEGVPLDIIRAGLYVDLGDPPTIASAKVDPLLEAFRRTGILAWVEAARRAEEGQWSGALKVLTDFVLVARQLADRSSRQEVLASMDLMAAGLEAIRDFAYRDFRGQRTLKPQDLLEVTGRLQEDGPLGIERIRWPNGPLLAARQLIERSYRPDGTINQDVFASTMARAGAGDRPLRLFSETAKWREIGSAQAGKKEMTDQVQRVNDDWAARWQLDSFDPRMGLAFAYDSMDKRSFGLADTAVRKLGELFPERETLRVEAVGTRTALGVYGYVQTTRTLPPTIFSIRPRFSTESDTDPMNPNRELGRKPPLQYFVPIRDTRDQFQGGAAEPHLMTVIIPNAENFQVRIGEDQFIVYSVGGDGARNWARLIENSPTPVPNADYLIWPPRESLVRQHLLDTGGAPTP